MDFSSCIHPRKKEGEIPSFFYGVKKELGVIKEPPAGVNDVLLDSRFRGNDIKKEGGNDERKREGGVSIQKSVKLCHISVKKACVL